MQRGFSRISLAALSIGLGLALALGGWASPALAKPSNRQSANGHRPVRDRVVALRDIKGTDTVLSFDATAVAKLKAAGVSIGVAGSAKASGADFALPISSGYVETHSQHSFKPSDLLGSIEHFGGGVTLTSSGASIELSDLVFDLGQSMVYVSVGGAENVPFFALQQSSSGQPSSSGQQGSLPVQRSGHTLKIGPVQLVLTATGAAELDAIFQTSSLLAPSTVVATASITATGSISRYQFNEVTNEFPRLAGVDTSVSFEPASSSELAKVGVAPSANGSATYDAGSGVIDFPITGGSLVAHPDKQGDPKSVDGVVLAQGSGITFSKGSTSMTMDEPTWVPATGIVYASVNGGLDNGPVFRVTTAHAKFSFVGGNLMMSGARIVLTPGGAAALDTVFRTGDFTAGAPLGNFSMVASGA